jgi:hypothetical protein
MSESRKMKRKPNYNLEKVTSGSTTVSASVWMRSPTLIATMSPVAQYYLLCVA